MKLLDYLVVSLIVFIPLSCLLTFWYVVAP